MPSSASHASGANQAGDNNNATTTRLAQSASGFSGSRRSYVIGAPAEPSAPPNTTTRPFPQTRIDHRLRDRQARIDNLVNASFLDSGSPAPANSVDNPQQRTGRVGNVNSSQASSSTNSNNTTTLPERFNSVHGVIQSPAFPPFHLNTTGNRQLIDGLIQYPRSLSPLRHQASLPQLHHLNTTSPPKSSKVVNASAERNSNININQDINTVEPGLFHSQPALPLPSNINLHLTSRPGYASNSDRGHGFVSTTFPPPTREAPSVTTRAERSRENSLITTTPPGQIIPEYNADGDNYLVAPVVPAARDRPSEQTELFHNVSLDHFTLPNRLLTSDGSERVNTTNNTEFITPPRQIQPLGITEHYDNTIALARQSAGAYNPNRTEAKVRLETSSDSASTIIDDSALYSSDINVTGTSESLTSPLVTSSPDTAIPSSPPYTRTEPLAESSSAAVATTGYTQPSILSPITEDETEHLTPSHLACTHHPESSSAVASTTGYTQPSTLSPISEDETEHLTASHPVCTHYPERSFPSGSDIVHPGLLAYSPIIVGNRNSHLLSSNTSERVASTTFPHSANTGRYHQFSSFRDTTAPARDNIWGRGFFEGDTAHNFSSEAHIERHLALIRAGRISPSFYEGTEVYTRYLREWADICGLTSYAGRLPNQPVNEDRFPVARQDFAAHPRSRISSAPVNPRREHRTLTAENGSPSLVNNGNHRSVSAPGAPQFSDSESEEETPIRAAPRAVQFRGPRALRRVAASGALRALSLEHEVNPPAGNREVAAEHEEEVVVVVEEEEAEEEMVVDEELEDALRGDVVRMDIILNDIRRNLRGVSTEIDVLDVIEAGAMNLGAPAAVRARLFVRALQENVAVALRAALQAIDAHRDEGHRLADLVVALQAEGQTARERAIANAAALEEARFELASLREVIRSREDRRS